MLYKKYHRSYVSQFKKGTKYKFKYSPHEDAIKDIVWIEPRYLELEHNIEIRGLYDYTWLTIVFRNGKINNIKLVEERVV